MQPFEEMVFTKEGAMESKKIDLMFAFQKFLDEHFLLSSTSVHVGTRKSSLFLNR